MQISYSSNISVQHFPEKCDPNIKREKVLLKTPSQKNLFRYEYLMNSSAPISSIAMQMWYIEARNQLLYQITTWTNIRFT